MLHAIVRGDRDSHSNLNRVTREGNIKAAGVRRLLKNRFFLSGFFTIFYPNPAAGAMDACD